MCEALDDLATDVDLLLIEASFRHGDDNPASLHLTGREAGQVAARNGVPRVVLTHVPPWFQMGDMMAEAAEVYDGHLNAALPARRTASETSARLSQARPASCTTIAI